MEEPSFEEKDVGSGHKVAPARSSSISFKPHNEVHKEKIIDGKRVNQEKRVLPLGKENALITGKGIKQYKGINENQSRKRKGKRRYSTSVRRRLHNYEGGDDEDNESLDESIRNQKDEGGDDDLEEEKDDVERKIERKEKVTMLTLWYNFIPCQGMGKYANIMM